MSTAESLLTQSSAKLAPHGLGLGREMNELLSWQDCDERIVVEVEADEEGYVGVTRGVGGTIGEVHQSFHEALAKVRGAAITAIHTFHDKAVGADEVELEFGVKLTAEAGAVIAKTATEGHLTVKLKWRRAEAPSTDSGGVEAAV